MLSQIEGTEAQNYSFPLKLLQNYLYSIFEN